MEISSAIAASSLAKRASRNQRSRRACRRAHGRGYATEAAEAVVDAAAATGRKRLWAAVRAWNGPSFRVLEKLGFHRSDRVTEDPARGDVIWMTRKL
jgi:RimJ/RimL family protein N-acetyltransferase